MTYFFSFEGKNDENNPLLLFLGGKSISYGNCCKNYSFTQTGLISGVIWVVYHYPLLIGLVASRLGVSAWPLLITSMIGGIGISFIVAWLRLRSGSLWTAVIFHAALNAHNQGFFQNLTIETSDWTNYISGEYGLMMALVTAVAAYLFWRKRDSLPEPQR